MVSFLPCLNLVKVEGLGTRAEADALPSPAGRHGGRRRRRARLQLGGAQGASSLLSLQVLEGP